MQETQTYLCPNISCIVISDFSADFKPFSLVKMFDILMKLSEQVCAAWSDWSWPRLMSKPHIRSSSRGLPHKHNTSILNLAFRLSLYHISGR